MPGEALGNGGIFQQRLGEGRARVECQRLRRALPQVSIDARVDGLTVVAGLRAADRVEGFERETERVERGVARSTAGIGDVLAQAFAVGQRRRWRRHHDLQADLRRSFQLFAQQLAHHEIAALDRARDVFMCVGGQKAGLLQHAQPTGTAQRRPRSVAGQPIETRHFWAYGGEATGQQRLHRRAAVDHHLVDVTLGLAQHERLERVVAREQLAALGGVEQAVDLEPLQREAPKLVARRWNAQQP